MPDILGKRETAKETSSFNANKKKNHSNKLQTKEHDEQLRDYYLPSAAILLRISWAVLKMPRVGLLQTKHFLFFVWCWKREEPPVRIHFQIKERWATMKSDWHVL